MMWDVRLPKFGWVDCPCLPKRRTDRPSLSAKTTNGLTISVCQNAERIDHLCLPKRRTDRPPLSAKTPNGLTVSVCQNVERVDHPCLLTSPNGSTASVCQKEPESGPFGFVFGFLCLGLCSISVCAYGSGVESTQTWERRPPPPSDPRDCHGTPSECRTHRHHRRRVRRTLRRSS